jgi:alpha-galactosidase
MSAWHAAILELLLTATVVGCTSGGEDDVTCADLTEPIIEATVEGAEAWVFNGIPETWGEDQVLPVRPGMADDRSMRALGGIPVVDVFTEQGGVALMNTSDSLEPFRVLVTSDGDRTTLCASGGSRMERIEHEGDFFTALREYASRMAEQGIATRPAPDWVFEPHWETYGFEEDFDAQDILDLVPLLQELGVGSITLDSGWYGRGRGEDWESMTGDFPVNPDVIGTEEDLRDLIGTLHREGFRVRLWWVPGVAEEETEVAEAHPDWLLTPVESSTGDTADVYLDPTRPEVVEWNRGVVARLLGYGADGFKQDDVYEVISDEPAVHRAYSGLFHDIFEHAAAIQPNVGINTCNCGVAQNVYDFPGENMLITSDPVGSRQLRMRARIYRALDLGGAALLGDHVELTRGDVGGDELDEPGFYDSVDFASIVPLGLVLQTKLRGDPGELYRTWFALYRDYRFFDMEWVDIPYFGGVERYLLRDGDDLVFSFFSETPQDAVTLDHLTPGQTYSVVELPGEDHLLDIAPSGDTYELDVRLENSLVLAVLAADGG